jgi:prepilin-type N-terminal cleavage/methylation domain-containing protein
LTKGERGFTLVELMVSIAITGMIFGVLGEAIHQVLTIPEYGNDRITAMHEVQNVVHWVNLDGQKAQTATGGNRLVLTFPDASSANYTLVGTNLIRTTSTTNRTLAQNIASANFSIQNRYLTVSLSSSPTGRWNVSDNETYTICLRPEENF